MSTAEAILKLRKKLGYNQQRLAELLQVTVVTVSRYENGREPTAKALKRLADLAEDAQAGHLQELFTAKLKGDVASRLESLPSTGAERRVPKFWFTLWMARQEYIFYGISGLMKKGADLSPKHRAAVLAGIRKLAEQTWTDMRTFRAESVPDLDPNEDFSSPKLYSTSATGDHKLDWMECLYGPSAPTKSRGVLSRQIRVWPKSDAQKSEDRK